MPARLLALTLLACSCATPSAQRPLQCTYVYGGEEKVVRISPTADPYSVPLVELGDRLGWKAVYVTAPEELAVISIYTYFLSEQGPVLIHQAKYRPPFPQDGSKALTGVHAIYEPRNSSELQYWCGWAR
ncbi:MAG TPA: hypothetical protein VJ860_03655 [Polyangia bacterium]|jgi:hypothetical protein|nr:hypothetical protein [Polyangia bacterium]